jgi:HlyD family secretion protein
VSRRLRVRLLLAAAAALGVGAGGFALCSAGGGGDERGYVTETVDRGEIEATVTATGVVNPVTTVQVGTYVSGPIREIDVDFNSPVSRGQRVAKIDPAPFQVRVDQAEANLENAHARVRRARADLALKRLTRDRNQELRGRNLISQSELDAAESSHDQAVAELALEEAGVRQAGSALAEARVNLDYTEIRSPVDGVVVSRNVDVGQTVAASFQTPTLFLIAEDLTRMQVEAKVSESDIGGVREGQLASFSVDAYPSRTFQGEVVQVRNAPTTVQNVVTYDVVVRVDNASLELKPGMTAAVTITTDRRDDAVRLPVRALRFRPEPQDGEPAAAATAPADAGAPEPAVYVLDASDELRRVPVRTGLANERWAELLSEAPGPGDSVVVSYERAARSGPAPSSPLAPNLRRR